MWQTLHLLTFYLLFNPLCHTDKLEVVTGREGKMVVMMDVGVLRLKRDELESLNTEVRRLKD